MKVGSLVECIKEGKWDGFSGITMPVVGKIYTVRGFYESKIGFDTSLYLEEIVNGKYCFGIEPSFEIECFREVIPPMEVSLEAIIEEEVEV
jgi:hypothetical protein